MDPLAALALAGELLKAGDALLNAYIATKASVAAADIEVRDAHLIALQQANAALSAKVHAELQAIEAKGATP